MGPKLTNAIVRMCSCTQNYEIFLIFSTGRLCIEITNTTNRLRLIKINDVSFNLKLTRTN